MIAFVLLTMLLSAHPMSRVVFLCIGIPLVAANTAWHLTWSDCGGVAALAHVISVSPTTVTLGKVETHITADLSADVEGATWSSHVAAGGLSFSDTSGDVCKQDITETGVFGVTVAKFTSVPLDCPLTKGTIMLSSHAETIDVLPDWFPAEPVQTNFRVKTSAGKGMTPIVVGLAGVIGGLLGVAVGVVAGRLSSASQQIEQPALLA